MLYHVTERRLLSEILDQGLIPRIGKRSEKIGEKAHAIYLFPDLTSCENALLNWLGEEFEDLSEDALVILVIDDYSLSFEDCIEYERVVYDIIPASCIRMVLGENLIPQSGCIEEIA